MDGVRVGVIAQDGAEKLRSPVAQHWRVDDVLNVEQLEWAARNVAERIGGADVLFAAYEQLQVQMAMVRERMQIDGMSADVARNFRDKSRMKDLFNEHAIPCARHAKITSGYEAAHFGYPMVYKPLEGAGARSTFRIDNADQLHDALRIAPPPVLLEEFITGEEHSFEGVCVDGRLVWHSLTHYSPTPLEVLQNDWIQWCILLPREIDDPRYDDIRDAGARALAALGMRTGLCHLEWFRRLDGSIAISEVAARPPGAQIMDLVSYAHEIDFDEAWVRLMIFGTFELPSRKWATGVAFLRGQGSGRVAALHRVEEIAREIGSLVVQAKLPSIGQAPAGGYEGEGYIIVRHQETRVVEAALQRIIELIRVELG
ncbi:MAG TPA: ATP-grasp domain-containing protein [Thermoanaerobaculia bacterium]|nr:ATP-grasp domain-containing protein [Thermoanaerobaculia bacterium]